jgi:hypothetical protein
VNQVTDTVIFLLIIATVVVAAICGRKPKSQSAHRGQKRTGRLYHDYDQFQLAMQIWDRDRLLFEQNETARLAQLNQKVKKGGAFSTFSLFCVVVVALVIGFSDGAVTGWGFLLLGMLPIGIIMTIEVKFYRWRHEALFVRREFGEPQPVYQKLPPHRTSEPVRPNEPARVTSLRRAYEILGIPPGRITIEAARMAYRQRMAEYHPDKVAHLGPELRELAERKATEFNLAIKYIEKG